MRREKRSGIELNDNQAEPGAAPARGGVTRYFLHSLDPARAVCAVVYSAGMDRPQLIRSLRIAWTAAFGIFCVLLIGLWVRSYKCEDRASGHINSLGVRLYSSRGWIVCFKNNAISPGQYTWSCELGRDYWLAPNDSRLQFTSPGAFFGKAATSNISTPHFPAVAIAVLLAAVPWVRYRFSLRALLISVTLIAVALGLLVWSLQ